MKYIDLHLHLDGAVTVDIAKRLADIQGITLPADNDDELKRLLQVPPDCTDLNEFLKCFALPCSLLQTYEALSEAVYLVLKDCAKHDVVYAELRYAPQLHTESGMSQEDAIRAAIDGLKRSPIRANLILCMMRGEGNEDANELTLSLAEKYLTDDGGVVAVDLAGAEGLFPTRNYRDIFIKAKDMGVPFTIHAGEAAGADSVRDAIEYGTARIGHGTRSFEDKTVLNDIIRKNIPLEMCPTSNIQTHAIDSIRDFPLINYLDAGVCVTVNTDDPAIEGTSIDREFALLEREFGLTTEQKRQIITNSIRSAFTTDEVKDELNQLIW